MRLSCTGSRRPWACRTEARPRLVALPCLGGAVLAVLPCFRVSSLAVAQFRFSAQVACVYEPLPADR
eukprot:2652032-Alexandrium_andersonii.AAC.1